MTFMKKIYFKEEIDVSNEVEMANWKELNTRFTPNRPYIILEVNYITSKNTKSPQKNYLIQNDYGVGEWVYETNFCTQNEFRNKLLNIIIK